MAEFFVLDWTYRHWMDDLTPQQVADRVAQNPNFQVKYDSRMQPGDIKEVYPDGHLPAGAVISPSTKEMCIKVPGVSYDAAKQYIEAHLDNTDPNQPVILLRRRYKVDWTRISQAVKDQLAVTRIGTFPNVAQLRIVDKAA